MCVPFGHKRISVPHDAKTFTVEFLYHAMTGAQLFPLSLDCAHSTMTEVIVLYYGHIKELSTTVYLSVLLTSKSSPSGASEAPLEQRSVGLGFMLPTNFM
jgi:hypothetical protein